MSIIAQLTEAKDRIEALQSRQVEIETGHADALAAVTGQLSEVTAERDAITAEHATLTERAAALEADMTQARADLEALTTERDGIKAEADKLQRALDNPAFAGIAAAGEPPVTDGGGDADRMGLIEQLEAISDPRERSRFYKANKAAIKAEAKKGA